MAALVMAVLVPAGPAAAATITVSMPGGGGQYTSIQAAVNAARSGDTVRVSPGTYIGNIRIGHYVNLVSTDGPGATILRPQNASAAVVTILAVRYTTSGQRMTLSGFTVQDGVGPTGHAGGITIFSNADPLIENNIIKNNRAEAYGGGISVHQESSPIIRNNTITANSAFRGGGGIFVGRGSSPIIYGNDITNNNSRGWTTTNGGSSGGGVYLEGGSTTIYPVLISNTIAGNDSDFAGGGVMLRTGAAAIIDSNTVDNNKAAYGAGIHNETDGASVTIENNTITNNIAAARGEFAGSGYGGGVSLYANANVSMSNNALTGNRASNGGGGVVIAEGASLRADSNTFVSNGVGPASPGRNAEGGGIYVAGGNLTVSNSVFVRNDAQLGGGIAVLDGGVSRIASNTFASNRASLAQGGSAVFVVNGAPAGQFSNNILAGNNNHQIFEQSIALVKRNNLFENTGATASYVAPGIVTSDPTQINGSFAGDGNFAANPGFTNAGVDDYSIMSGSGAIDKASASSDIGLYPQDDRRNAVRQTGPPDVGAFEYEASPLIKQTVYRFWSTSKSSHFYTISVAERNAVASGYSPVEWRYEGRAYDAFDTQIPGTVPLYRFYSQSFNGHFYTPSEEERNYVRDNYPTTVWNYEGPAFYVYPLASGGNTDVVFRFWSPDNRHHFYTASVAERDFVRNNYPANVWSYEGEQFRVPR